MTVAELIKKLKKQPQSLPVYHPSAPWGSPYEVETITRTEVVTRGYPTIKAILLDDNVGI